VKPEVRDAANADGRAAYTKARAEGKSRTDADHERARARYQSVSIAAGTKRYVTGLSDEERQARRLSQKQAAYQRKIGRPVRVKRTPEEKRSMRQRKRDWLRKSDPERSRNI
jgi:hypothetical protein